MKRHQVHLIGAFMVTTALFPLGAQLEAQEGLLTVAERSGFAATSRHADVMAFAAELRANVTVIERYGHMLPIEAPRQTLQKLRELIGPLENV